MLSGSFFFVVLCLSLEVIYFLDDKQENSLQKFMHTRKTHINSISLAICRNAKMTLKPTDLFWVLQNINLRLQEGEKLGNVTL